VIHTFETETTIPLPVEEVFPFFADAFNLEAITPPLLRFRVVTPAPIEMRAGAIIDYKLRIRGVPWRWRTEIAEWDPPRGFVDRQLKGPYRLWHHTHTFEAIEGGASTLMRDIVRYELPRVPGRSIMHRLLVRPDIEKIFEFRERKIRELLVERVGRGSRPGAPRPEGAHAVA